MDRYIGIDAHLTSCTVATMGPSGKKLNCNVVETSGKALVSAIKLIPGKRHVCIEEGGFSEWLYEILRPHAEQVVVVQPKRHRGSKSDSIDAFARADELRRGDYQPIFKDPGTMSRIRAATKSYLMIRDDVARAKHQLKATFRLRGIRVGSEVFDPLARRALVEQLPAELAHQALLLGDKLDYLGDKRDEALDWINEELDHIPDARVLMSIPGIAAVRAATLLATVISPDRFRSKRQFWAYCGLAVVTRSSSDWKQDSGRWARKPCVQTRGLNKDFQPQVKDVFKGAAYIVSKRCSSDHPWRRAYQRQLDNGIKPNLAELTLARRIAATTLALWKRKELYDPQKTRCATN